MAVKSITISILIMGLVTIIAIIMLWLFTTSHFNPVTNRDLIKGMHSILTKLEKYEASTPIPDNELGRSYLYVDYTEEEKLLFEPRGLYITREQGGYKVAIPHGFDNRVYYLHSENCWYGSWKPVGLPICPESVYR